MALFNFFKKDEQDKTTIGTITANPKDGTVSVNILGQANDMSSVPVEGIGYKSLSVGEKITVNFLGNKRNLPSVSARRRKKRMGGGPGIIGGNAAWHQYNGTSDGTRNFTTASFGTPELKRSIDWSSYGKPDSVLVFTDSDTEYIATYTYSTKMLTIYNADTGDFVSQTDLSTSFAAITLYTQGTPAIFFYDGKIYATCFYGFQSNSVPDDIYETITLDEDFLNDYHGYSIYKPFDFGSSPENTTASFGEGSYYAYILKVAIISIVGNLESTETLNGPSCSLSSNPVFSQVGYLDFYKDYADFGVYPPEEIWGTTVVEENYYCYSYDIYCPQFTDAGYNFCGTLLSVGSKAPAMHSNYIIIPVFITAGAFYDTSELTNSEIILDPSEEGSPIPYFPAHTTENNSWSIGRRVFSHTPKSNENGDYEKTDGAFVLFLRYDIDGNTMQMYPSFTEAEFADNFDYNNPDANLIYAINNSTDPVFATIDSIDYMFFSMFNNGYANSYLQKFNLSTMERLAEARQPDGTGEDSQRNIANMAVVVNSTYNNRLYCKGWYVWQDGPVNNCRPIFIFNASDLSYIGYMLSGSEGYNSLQKEISAYTENGGNVVIDGNADRYWTGSTYINKGIASEEDGSSGESREWNTGTTGRTMDKSFVLTNQDYVFSRHRILEKNGDIVIDLYDDIGSVNYTVLQQLAIGYKYYYYAGMLLAAYEPYNDPIYHSIHVYGSP